MRCVVVCVVCVCVCVCVCVRERERVRVLCCNVRHYVCVTVCVSVCVLHTAVAATSACSPPASHLHAHTHLTPVPSHAFQAAASAPTQQHAGWGEHRWCSMQCTGPALHLPAPATEAQLPLFTGTTPTARASRALTTTARGFGVRGTPTSEYRGQCCGAGGAPAHGLSSGPGCGWLWVHGVLACV